MLELLQKISSHDNKICIAHNSISYTYKQLFEQTAEYADKFASSGIIPGKIVILKGDYSFYSIALMLALAKNKNVIVPVTALHNAELQDRITESRADIMLEVSDSQYSVQFLPGKEKHQLIIQLNQAQKSGLILFSSGSTGRPKAMVHDFDNLVSTYIGRRGKDLIFLVFLLFDHIGGVNTLLNSLSMGSTIVIPEKREPEHICQLIERYRINVLPSSPTFLNLILIALKERAYNLSTVRMITYGTEPMTESLLMRVREKFPKVRLLQTFGTSETGIARTSSQSSTSTLMKIENGDTQYKIVDGELWLKSTTQILGYLNYSMESFTDDGWFRTGDMVEETDDGYLRILGRFKEVINVGGEKVLPSEVESVVMELSEVDDCIAYGLPNALTGQAVAIKITSKNKDEKFLKKLVKAHCKKVLETFKVPTKIELIDEVRFNDRFKKIRFKR